MGLDLLLGKVHETPDNCVFAIGLWRAGGQRGRTLDVGTGRRLSGGGLKHQHVAGRLPSLRERHQALRLWAGLHRLKLGLWVVGVRGVLTVGEEQALEITDAGRLLLVDGLKVTGDVSRR